MIRFTHAKLLDNVDADKFINYEPETFKYMTAVQVTPLTKALSGFVVCLLFWLAFSPSEEANTQHRRCDLEAKLKTRLHGEAKANFT